MRDFIKLLGRFREDESGVFGVIFGVIAVVLIAMSGAVVDYVTMEQARNRAQIAIDSAALALQPKIYTLSNSALNDLADEWLKERITDPRITASVENIATDTDAGSIVITARLVVPTTFVGLVGFSEFTPTVVSEATRKKLFVEVALVLDNSGSMNSHSRMSNLKTAAKSAADIIFDYQDTSDNSYIGIVPFNFWVNIGSGSASETWMDQNGLSSASHQGFDDDDDDSNTFAGPLDRFEIYNQMDGISWAGCVEARPQPYDADDTEPTAANPDTLFVPALSPDQPDSGDYPGDYLDDDPPACSSSRTCEWTRVRNGCNWKGNRCDSGGTNTFKATYPDSTVDTSPGACSCSGESIWPGQTTTVVYNPSDGAYDKIRVRTCTDYYGASSSSLSDMELQERSCKYTGSFPSNIGVYGPNAGCITTEVLPLSNSRPTVKARIDAMVANGATNIHQGAIWGFHMLSPTEPYTEGRPYDTATYKVMIIMTDGENTYYSYNDDSDDLNGASYYPPYNWPVYGRLGDKNTSDAVMEDLVDGRLEETCENAKDAGIDVFTVGLESPNNVKDMLRACATETSQAYFPSSSSELVDIFEEIAGQLSDLRLAQ